MLFIFVMILFMSSWQLWQQTKSYNFFFSFTEFECGHHIEGMFNVATTFPSYTKQYWKVIASDFENVITKYYFAVVSGQAHENT